MKRCLVSLVSDQTIPNILAAAALQPDFMLLVSTARMESKEKSAAILETLKDKGLDYTHRSEVVEVTEDSINDFDSKVSEWVDRHGRQYEFSVNLTGGTKLMALAAFDLFTEYGGEMIYVPILKNEYLVPFPKRRAREPVPLEARLSVAEYLRAYRLVISNAESLHRYQEEAFARRQISRYILKNYMEVRPMLEWLYQQLKEVRKRKCRAYALNAVFHAQTAEQGKLIDLLGFRRDGDRLGLQIDKSLCGYLTGGWLEEALFLTVRDVLPPDSDVRLNVICSDPNGNQNEFDVLFTLDNVLYLIECKSLSAPAGSDTEMGGTIQDYLYKLGALRHNFGLTPKAFLVTMSEKVLAKNGQIDPRLVDRGRQLGASIVSLLQVADLEGYFKSSLRL